MARHLVLSMAASVLSLPSQVFTTPPMVEPPPSCQQEKEHRRAVSLALDTGWGFRDGFDISRSEEMLVDAKAKYDNEDHHPSTYGEVTELGARQLFYYMKLPDEPIYFMDLGSGAGKLVVLAYMEISQLYRAVGIELAPARHKVALGGWNKLQETGIAKQARAMTNDFYKDASLELHQGDLFQADVSKATHIYMASLCFTDTMMERVAKKLVGEASNLQCVATLKEFPKQFETTLGAPRTEFVEMSWTSPRGCVVFFYTPR